MATHPGVLLGCVATLTCVVFDDVPWPWMSEYGIFFKEGRHLSYRVHCNAAQTPIDFSR